MDLSGLERIIYQNLVCIYLTQKPVKLEQYTSVSAVTVTASAFNADIQIIFVTVHPEVFVPALSLLLRSWLHST